MSDFKQFADAVNRKFLELSANGILLRTNISKDQLWDIYQSAYSQEANPIFRERRVHDCNTCKSFINRIGGIVGITNGKIDTIWNVTGLSPVYQTVADAMHKAIVQAGISTVFLTDEHLAGKEYNIEANEAGDIRWDHFYADINQTFVTQSPASDRSEIEGIVTVFKRGLDEFSIGTLESGIDLCDSIYRGEEFKPLITKFLEAKIAYEQSNQGLFIWTEYKNYPAKLRGTAIGTLLIDIAEGTDLETAVAKYEKVVAPENYKRTTAVVTEGMKKQAIATIDELGLRESLPRRHATLTDISVNNVLFANADAQTVMKDPIDALLDLSVTKTAEAPKSAQELTIEQFLANVLPNSRNVEVLLENRHTPNFVSLVAPVNPTAPNMLKWNNNFSWSYAGEVTDAMKERVKAAGGSVTGDVRFSIQWNESGMDSSNDLDAHCSSLNEHIYFGQRKGHLSKGELDVDIQRPGKEIAVENITWESIKTIPDGHYELLVDNFSGINRNGFRAQIEILGELYEYNYNQPLSRKVTVAEFIVKSGKVTINHSLPCSTTSKKAWELDTKSYQKVSTIMLSPNHWDGQTIGNKHYFFMLEGCTNPDPVRGFYNEFLSEELRPHRKVFEALSSSMKCIPTKDQLSGLGFSSTIRNELFVKVDNRPYKILF